MTEFDYPDLYSYAVDEGHGLAHDPLLAILGPRPIGWISSLSAEGVRNLAPYSFFNMFSSRPPIVGFASNGHKNTERNLAATHEFVWNLVTRDLAEAMNVTSAEVEPDVDEFDLARLVAAPSLTVAPPRVATSPASFECRVTQMLPLLDRSGRETSTILVLGQVTTVHVHRSLLADGRYDTARARPVLRAGGRGDYFEIRSEGHFHMPRPG